MRPRSTAPARGHPSRGSPLPLAGPSLSALAIITFNSTWNNYFYPLIFLTTWDKMTLPLGITALRGFIAAATLRWSWPRWR